MRGSAQVATGCVQAVSSNLSFQTSAAAFFPFCTTSFSVNTSCQDGGSTDTQHGQVHGTTHRAVPPLHTTHSCPSSPHHTQLSLLSTPHRAVHPLAALQLTLTRCRGPAAMFTTPSHCWRRCAIIGSRSGSSWSGCSARCRTAWKARCSSGLNMSLGRNASHLPPSSSLHRGDHTHHTTPHYTTPCHATPRHTTPHHTMPRHTTPHHTTPHTHHTTPHYTTLHHTTPHYTTPCHTPHHTTPRHKARL